MAYGTKYRLAYTDNFSQAVQIDIQQDGYSGSVTAVKGAGTPLIIEHDTQNDFVFEPILGTWVRLRLLATSNFLYSELFTTDSREWKIEVEIASAVYFTGFILPDNYQQPYKAAPYHIEIVATDQLGALHGLPYEEMEEYSVRTPQQMLEYILNQTELDLNMREAINLYETNMNSTSADSPIDQCWIDQDAYVEDSKVMDCYTVLRDLLLKFTAVIRQVNNEWHIWRPAEQLTSYNRRLWTWNSTTKEFAYTSIASYDPRLTTTQEPETHADRIRIMNNGGMMMIAPWKQYDLNHDYGVRDTFLLNSDFTQWINTTTPTHWSKGDPITATQYGEKIRIESDLVFASGSYLMQSISVSPVTAQALSIKAKYDVYCPTGEAGSFHIMLKVIKQSDSSEKWYDFTTETWEGSQKYLSQVFSAGRSSGSVEVITTGLNPFASDYDLQVFIHTPTCTHADGYVDLDSIDIKLIRTGASGDFATDADELVTVNAVNNYIPSDINILTADLPDIINSLLIYSAGIYLDADRASLTTEWGDSSQSLLYILKEIVNNQYEQTVEMLTVNIYSKLIKGDSTIVESDHSSNKYFINRMSYDQKHGVYRLELTQLYTTGEFLQMESEDYLLQEDGSSFFII